MARNSGREGSRDGGLTPRRAREGNASSLARRAAAPNTRCIGKKAPHDRLGSFTSFPPSWRVRFAPRADIRPMPAFMSTRPNQPSVAAMEWKVHYFDRRAGQDRVSRSHSTSEGALRNACDLMRQNCRVDYITGPSNERIDAPAIESWCKAHPNRRQPEGR